MMRKGKKQVGKNDEVAKDKTKRSEKEENIGRRDEKVTWKVKQKRRGKKTQGEVRIMNKRGKKNNEETIS